MRNLQNLVLGSPPAVVERSLEVGIALRISRASAVMTFLIALSFTPFGYLILSSPDFALMSVCFAVAYLLCYLLMHSPFTGLSRVVFVAVLCAHYAIVLRFVGTDVALETLLICLVGLPLLMFARSETSLVILSYGIIFCSVCAAEWASYTYGAALEYDEPIRVLAYFSNIATAATIILFLLYTYSRSSVANYIKLQSERARSEQMLHDLLPSAVADQIIRGEDYAAHSSGECTVLFADLVAFNKLTENLSPIHVVELLNRIFSEIDELCEEHGVEKIKTIGDCYMAAIGALPGDSEPERMAFVGLGIVEIVRKYAAETGYPLAVRVGINTGQVISGVIGTRRRLFDIWGQTVNLAQLLESRCEPNRVLVSETAHWRLRRSFDLDHSGVVVSKAGHHVNAFYIRPMASADAALLSVAPRALH